MDAGFLVIAQHHNNRWMSAGGNLLLSPRAYSLPTWFERLANKYDQKAEGLYGFQFHGDAFWLEMLCLLEKLYTSGKFNGCFNGSRSYRINDTQRRGKRLEFPRYHICNVLVLLTLSRLETTLFSYSMPGCLAWFTILILIIIIKKDEKFNLLSDTYRNVLYPYCSR